MLPALISIFIGNFLVGLIFKPALEKLSKIQEEFISIKIPSRDPLLKLFRPAVTPEQRREERASARRRFDEIYRKYRLAYQPFRSISYIFLATMIFLGIIAVFNLQLDLIWSTAYCCAVTTIIFSFAYFLSYTSYPWPMRLANLDFLINAFPNLHPDSLIDLMGLRCTWLHEVGQTSLYLATAIPTVGYRYVVLITDEAQTKTFYAVSGSVTEKSPMVMAMSPETTQYQFKIGSLDTAELSALELPLSIHLYAFIPDPVSWIGRPFSPCLVTESLTSVIGKQVGWALAGIAECRSDRRDEGIRFKRWKWWVLERWEITDISSAHKQPNQYLRDFLRTQKREIEQKWSNEDFPALTN
jgi:hypothetical protein